MKKRHGLLAVLLLMSALALSGCQQEKKPVETPPAAAEEVQKIGLPEEVTTLQLNGILIDKPQERIDAFVEKLSQVTPVGKDSAAAPVEENFHVVTLHKQAVAKKSYIFFQYPQKDGKWYVADEDGNVFENADFITEFIKVSEGDFVSQGQIRLPDAEALAGTLDLHLRLKEAGAPYSTTDLRAFFAMKMQEQKALYETEEEAIAAARELLTKEIDQYVYAVSEGIALTDAEVEERIEKENEMLKAADGFAGLDKAFAEHGISFDEYRQEMKEYSKVRYTLERLYEVKYENYRYGDIMVGGKRAESMTDYWNYYLLDVVFPTMENYNEKTLAPLLDEAEEFYKTLK